VQRHSALYNSKIEVNDKMVGFDSTRRRKSPLNEGYTFDLRQTRYIGLAKSHLQHIFIACGMNLMRLARWLSGETPAQPRPTAFTRLYNASFDY